MAQVAWADIARVGAIFEENRLASATLHVRDEEAELRKRLAQAYPDSIRGMGRTLHVIDRDAGPDGILSVAVGPSRDPGVKSVVTFMPPTGAGTPMKR